MQQYTNIVHNFPPVYDSSSKILILGTFPSVKSREAEFYYAHPQNRFWKVLAKVLNAPLPESIEEKQAMLLKHHIALWDTVASCSITGSGDASIRDVVPNDIGMILRACPIRAVYTNGGKAHELYRRHIFPQTGIEDIRLPSTSPANAAWSLEKLCGEWKNILKEF